MQRKKIAFFTNMLGLGGTAKGLLPLIRGFMEAGVEVDLVVIRRAGECLPLFESHNISIIDLQCKSQNAFPILALRRYLRMHTPYALIATGGFRSAIAILAQLLSGTDTKVVLSEYGIPSYATLNPKHSFLIKMLILQTFRWSAVALYRFADRIVALSSSTARQLEELALLKKGTVAVIYLPIAITELAQYARMPTDHPWLQQKEEKVILAAGRLHPVKDFLTLLEAFHIVRQRLACKLILLGEGAERDHLTQCIHRLGIHADVEMPGFVENPYAYMSRADVFVISSKFESFSNVAIEALACGCPIVATDCPGGIREVLDDGRYGMLVPVGNASALADAMEKALKENREVIAERQKTRAVTFSADTVLAQYKVLLGI